MIYLNGLGVQTAKVETISNPNQQMLVGYKLAWACVIIIKDLSINPTTKQRPNTIHMRGNAS
jgi:hypothetical protein